MIYSLLMCFLLPKNNKITCLYQNALFFAARGRCVTHFTVLILLRHYVVVLHIEKKSRLGGCFWLGQVSTFYV